jgi:hypothetical protein
VTRSIRGPRRAALAGAAAAAATLLLSGCGAGQIAETAAMKPAVPGVNAQTADNNFKIRNLTLDYPGVKGYQAGASAPIAVGLYNDSKSPVTVKVTTTGARSVVLAGGSGQSAAPGGTNPSASASAAPSATASASASPSGSASASPSGSASASPSPSETPAGAPASIEIPPNGFVILNRATGSFLQLLGLNSKVAQGQAVELTFDFGGQQIKVNAPIGVPLTPAPVESPVVPEGVEGHNG